MAPRKSKADSQPDAQSDGEAAEAETVEGEAAEAETVEGEEGEEVHVHEFKRMTKHKRKGGVNANERCRCGEERYRA